MLRDDPIVQRYPQYLPTEEEVDLAWGLLQQPENEALLRALEGRIAIAGCARSSLRRFCWQAREEQQRGAACAAAALRWLERCIASRERLGMDGVLQVNFFSSHFRHLYNAAMPFSFHGSDRHGRPVFVVRYGAVDIAAFQRLWREGARLQESRGLAVNGAVLYHLRAMEYMSHVRMARASERHGRVVDRMLMVMDLKGLSRRHYDQSLLAFLGDVARELAPLYPETLHATVVAHVPRMVASALWPLARTWMRPVTRAKFAVLASPDAVLKRLQELIDFDEIPSLFGGGCRCPECISGQLRGGSLWEWEEEMGLHDASTSCSSHADDDDAEPPPCAASPDANAAALEDLVAAEGGDFRAVALIAATAALLSAGGGGVAGGLAGGVFGAGLGVLPAPLTFGLSIPAGLAMGAAAGACVGSVTAGSVGLLSGGAASYYWRRLQRRGTQADAGGNADCNSASQADAGAEPAESDDRTGDSASAGAAAATSDGHDGGRTETATAEVRLS